MSALDKVSGSKAIVQPNRKSSHKNDSKVGKIVNSFMEKLNGLYGTSSSTYAAASRR